MLPPLDTLLSAPVPTRSAVVDVLAWVMGADGELRPEEQQAVADVARRLDVPGRTSAPSWSEAWPELLLAHGGDVMLLAALLASADGDLAPAEEQCLALLASALDLDPGAPAALSTWALEGHRWLRKGQALAREARRGGYGVG